MTSCAYPVPVQSVRLSSKNAENTHAVMYENGQPVTFTEGQTVRFYCQVNGSYPEPRVRVLVGGGDGRDITRLFQKSVQLVRDGPPGGLQTFYYKVDLVDESLVIDYEFSGRQLRCVAGDPFDLLPVSSIAVNVSLTGCTY